MAKKAPAADFNMSLAIREILTANPKLTIQEASDAVLVKHPNAKINKNSFSVAFYNGQNKLGISVSGRRGKGEKATVVTKNDKPDSHSKVDMATLQTAAKFLSEVGSAEAAMEAIKQVQALQVK